MRTHRNSERRYERERHVGRGVVRWSVATGMAVLNMLPEPAVACTDCRCHIATTRETSIDCPAPEGNRDATVIWQWTGGEPAPTQVMASDPKWKRIGFVCDGRKGDRGPKGPSPTIRPGAPDAGASTEGYAQPDAEVATGHAGPRLEVSFLLGGTWFPAQVGPPGGCGDRSVRVDFTIENPEQAEELMTVCVPWGRNGDDGTVNLLIDEATRIAFHSDTISPAGAANGNETTTIPRPGDETFARARQSLLGGPDGIFGGTVGVRPFRLLRTLAARDVGRSGPVRGVHWDSLFVDSLELSGAVRQYPASTQQTVAATMDLFSLLISKPGNSSTDLALPWDDLSGAFNECVKENVSLTLRDTSTLLGGVSDCRRKTDPDIVGGLGASLTDRSSDLGAKAWFAADVRPTPWFSLTPATGVVGGKIADYFKRDSDSTKTRAFAGTRVTLSLRDTKLRGLEGGALEFEATHTAFEKSGTKVVDGRVGSSITIALRGGLELSGGVRATSFSGFESAEVVPVFSVGWADNAAAERRPALYLLEQKAREQFEALCAVFRSPPGATAEEKMAAKAVAANAACIAANQVACTAAVVAQATSVCKEDTANPLQALAFLNRLLAKRSGTD